MEELLGRGIDDLPATVAVRQIRSRHPRFGPGMEVPDGVERFTVGTALDLVAEDIEVLVDGQRVVGVVRRRIVGDGTGRNAQGSAHGRG